MTNSSNPNITISDTATVTINNDDFATVTVADISGNEDAGDMTLTFTLDKAVAGGFTFDVNTADGTATLLDLDYTQITSELVTFTGTVGEIQTVTFTPTADVTTMEGDENAMISMTNSSNANVSITDTATVTIIDDD